MDIKRCIFWNPFSIYVRLDVICDPVRIIALFFGKTYDHVFQFAEDCVGVNKWFACKPELSGIACNVNVFAYVAMFIIRLKWLYSIFS